MLSLLLAAGCYDPAAVVRRGQGGEGLEVYRTLRVETGTHTDVVTAMAVDRGQRLLLTGGLDKTARLWSMATGEPGPVLRPPIGDGDAGRIDAVALSHDGRLAAVGGLSAGTTRNAVLLFDTADGALLSRIERAETAAAGAGVERLAFAADGRRLGVRYRDDGAVRWYAITGGVVAVAGAPADAGVPAGSDSPFIDLAGGGRVEARGDRHLSRRDAAGRPLWDIPPAVPAVVRLDLSADGTVARMNWPQGSQIFSAEEMEDDLGRPVAFIEGPPAGRPALLADGGALSGDGGVLSRSGADGQTLWSTPLASRAVAVAASADGGIVAAALGDGTVRWFGGADGRERLALFFHPATDGWVVWTPRGFFDHSDNAWNFAGWHVNRGPRRAAEFVSIAQLYDVAYRPDLIRRAVAGIDEDVAAIGTGEAGNPAAVLERGLPPAVQVAVTPDPDRRHATVAVTAQERGAGIGKVVYRLNGVVVALDNTAAGVAVGSAGSVDLVRRIPLRTGPNQIEVVALDATNAIESAPAAGTVTDGRGDGARGGLKALVVGIDRYQDPSMRLAFAVSDAQAMAAALERQPATTFATIEVRRLLDAEATTDAISRAVLAMAGSMAESDTFLLYLVGHGVNLNGDYQFITHDVRRPTEDEVRSRALSQERLQALLAEVPADRAIVILDTCYSGGVAERYDRNVLMRTAHRRLARATGRGFLSAATSQQVAAEGYRGHGVLTAVLLDGLAGAADARRPDVSARELGTYAERTVPVIAEREFRIEQKPVFSLVGRDFPLSRGGAPIR